jgi:hypothetical protein
VTGTHCPLAQSEPFWQSPWPVGALPPLPELVVVDDEVVVDEPPGAPELLDALPPVPDVALDVVALPVLKVPLVVVKVEVVKVVMPAPVPPMPADAPEPHPSARAASKNEGRRRMMTSSG